MMREEQENDLRYLVQTGTVTAASGNQVRVKFPDTEIPSGWLTVLRAPPSVVVEDASGGSGEAAFASHSHGTRTSPWTPQVNDRVLVLYLPVPGGDGFVLGGI